MKYKIILEYDGTRYSGWQMQKNAKSIQGTLLETARKQISPDADVQGAGRTDAGVHALAQVAHLETSKRLEPDKVLFALNDNLPSNINILSVDFADARFHARHNAKSQELYLYHLQAPHGLCQEIRLVGQGPAGREENGIGLRRFPGLPRFRVICGQAHRQGLVHNGPGGRDGTSRTWRPHHLPHCRLPLPLADGPPDGRDTGRSRQGQPAAAKMSRRY